MLEQGQEGGVLYFADDDNTYDLRLFRLGEGSVIGYIWDIYIYDKQGSKDKKTSLGLKLVWRKHQIHEDIILKPIIKT